MKISEKVIKTIHEDEHGNISEDTIITTNKIEVSDEPDYIKLYTRMWFEFKGVPTAYTQLFLSLVCRMSYCNSNDLTNSQLVNTAVPWRDSIMAECGWKSAESLKKGLKTLCEANCIRKVGRGVYQINPQFAGKGEWKYNPRLSRGGVRDLIATFNFTDKSVNTQIFWADDGSDSDYNESIRQGLDVSKNQETVMMCKEIKEVIETPETVEKPKKKTRKTKTKGEKTA